MVRLPVALQGVQSELFFFQTSEGVKLLAVINEKANATIALERKLSDFIHGLNLASRDPDSFEVRLALGSLRALGKERSELIDSISFLLADARDIIKSEYEKIKFELPREKLVLERRAAELYITSSLLELSKKLDAMYSDFEKAEHIINFVDVRKKASLRNEFSARAELAAELRITLSRLEASQRRLKDLQTVAERRDMFVCSDEIAGVLKYIESISSQLVSQKSLLIDKGHVIFVESIKLLGQRNVDSLFKALINAGFVFSFDTEEKLLLWHSSSVPMRNIQEEYQFFVP